MVDDLCGFNRAFGIQHHHGIDRFARVGGCLDKIQGLIGVAHQLLAGIELLDGSVAFPGDNPGDFREGLLDDLTTGNGLILGQRRCIQGHGHDRREK